MTSRALAGAATDAAREIAAAPARATGMRPARRGAAGGRMSASGAAATGAIGVEVRGDAGTELERLGV